MESSVQHEQFSYPAERFTSPQAIQVVAAVCAVALIIAGLACVAGHAWGVEWLSNPIVGDAGTSPVAGACFVLIGCFLWRLRSRSSRPWEPVAMGALVLAILAAFQLSGQSENWLSLPARVCLFLPACVLLCFGAENVKIRRLSHVLITVNIAFAVLSILKYTYALNLLQLPGVDFAFHFETALLALLAAVGLLCIRPNDGFIRLIASPTLAGTMVRYLLPLVVFVPFLGLITGPLRHDVRDLAVALTIILCGLPALVLAVGRQLEQVELQRQEGLERLKHLYGLSQELLLVWDRKQLLSVVLLDLSKMLDCSAAIFCPDKAGSKRLAIEQSVSWDPSPGDFDAASEALDTNKPVQFKRSGANNSEALFVPLRLDDGPIVVGICRVGQRAELTHTDAELLKSVSHSLAVALDRVSFRESAQNASLESQRASQRAALLSSVSHDLRTPLSAISGAATTLLMRSEEAPSHSARELLQSINDEANRMNRLVQNLLDMTRLQSGITITRDWHSLEEVVGTTLARMAGRIEDHKVVTRLPEDLPLVFIEPLLIEQMLTNLLDNAVKYSDAGSEICISAALSDGDCSIEVSNTGSRLVAGEEVLVFERFFVGGQAGGGRRGTGLGLAICRAIAEAHGGKICAANMAEDGVAFLVTFPTGEAPPIMAPDEANGVDEDILDDRVQQKSSDH